jgi:protein TonB
MPRDLFGDVSDPSVRVGSRKWYTVPLSLFVHTVFLLLVVVIPLVATGALPDPRTTLNFVPLVPEIPLPPPAPVRRPPAGEQPKPNRNIPPRDAPQGITREPDPTGGLDLDTGDVLGGIPGGAEVLGSAVIEAPPPVVVNPPAPVRVGGQIRAPERLQSTSPIYLPFAQSARIQGIVIIEATIGADGRVVNARVLRSVPLLDEAALTAVRQWTYTPTLLNGVPVAVIMTVTVNFQLQQ